MRYLDHGVVLVLWLAGPAACSSSTPAPAPAPAKQTVDVHRALEYSQSEQSFQVDFESKLVLPGSTPLLTVGRCIWEAPGILLVTYEASGGEEKVIVRTRTGGWVYHSLLRDWVTAEEAGMDLAGRGMQDPQAVFAEVRHVLGRVHVEPRKGRSSPTLTYYDFKVAATGVNSFIRRLHGTPFTEDVQPEATGTVTVDEVSEYATALEIHLKYHVNQAPGKGMATFWTRLKLSGFGTSRVPVEVDPGFSSKTASGKPELIRLPPPCLSAIEEARKKR